MMKQRPVLLVILSLVSQGARRCNDCAHRSHAVSVGGHELAWGPSQPPPAGYLLVAVPIPNSINPATTSSNLTPGTALPTTRTIRSSHLSSTSGTELQNDVVQELAQPASGIETWDINSIDCSGGVLVNPNGLG